MMQRMNFFCFYYTDMPEKVNCKAPRNKSSRDAFCVCSVVFREDDVYLSDLLAAVQNNAGNSLVVGGVSVIVQTVR